MSSYNYAASDSGLPESRPDRPLVVKCSFDGLNKKITFTSSRKCSYDLLRQRIEQCFFRSARPYALTYTDDDGEVNDIRNDFDLTEAILFFHTSSEEAPLSSAASILSTRSFRGKITLRVRINVDYDGPSLSDTGSLVSVEEYRNRNGSEFSLSFSHDPDREVDDDSVTVSSKDMGSKYDVYRAAKGAKTIMAGPSRDPLIQKSSSLSIDNWDVESLSIAPSRPSEFGSQRAVPHTVDPFADAPPDNLRVFEHLKLQDSLHERILVGSDYSHLPPQSEHATAWLRDQSARNVHSIMDGALAEPSESDQDTGSVISGALSLQKDPRGRFYYSYTSGSPSVGSRSTHDSGYDDASQDIEAGSDGDSMSHSRPTSMEVNWPGAQSDSSQNDPLFRSSSSSSRHHVNHSSSEPAFLRDYIHPDTPPEVLSFITSTPPLTTPPPFPVECSSCGSVMDFIRYTCSTCGERKTGANGPVATGLDGKGKEKDSSTYATGEHDTNSRPRAGRLGLPSSPSASSWTAINDKDIQMSKIDSKTRLNAKPLRPLPRSPSSSSPSSGSSSSLQAGSGSQEQSSDGYELCSSCMHGVGWRHALEVTLAVGTDLGDWTSSPQDLSQYRRTAPKRKGQLRHAYIERLWGSTGWEAVEQDDHHPCKCSTCATDIIKHRYKCASCDNFNLCRACFGQVHEIHPSHAFLVVPDKRIRSRSERVIEVSSVPSGEASMTHPGVKCAHCFQAIVGARFHCAICCDSIDICSKCESAGLPGNLDASDGGHSSAHIMIKIPYPLETAELQLASSKVRGLWTNRDAADITPSRSRSRRNSLVSSYSRTVIGYGYHSGPTSSADVASTRTEVDDHGIRCNSCNERIFGARYQCANCPSKPAAYSLCASCEEKSYIVHDSRHIFFKLHRPLDYPLESELPMIPFLYRRPVGPAGGAYDANSPKEYLKNLVHSFAVCDRCMSRINGEWFRCAFCGKDLCVDCEAMDTHDPTHVFMVFKAPIDMALFREFAQLANPTSPPVITHSIYRA